jgi:hypothetical protein
MSLSGIAARLWGLWGGALRRLFNGTGRTSFEVAAKIKLDTNQTMATGKLLFSVESA